MFGFLTVCARMHVRSVRACRTAANTRAVLRILRIPVVMVVVVVLVVVLVVMFGGGGERVPVYPVPVAAEAS